MTHTNIRNNNYTNRIIQWLVIGGDFVVLWILLYFVVDFIPHSDDWNDDKDRIFWMICTLAMIMSEYRYSSLIHRRLVGAGDILQRSTMLVLTQTLLSYLILRILHFRAHIGWQFFFMGISMLVAIILLRFLERWALKQFRRWGYNMRKVTFIGSDPEIRRLHRKILSNPSYGYKLRSSYFSASDFVSRLAHPEELHLGDEVYMCAPRRERELIEQTVRICYNQRVKFYYVPPTDERLNLYPVFVDDMEVLATYTSPLEEPLNKLLKRLSDIFLSLLFLLPTALLFPFIAFIIKKQSPGPVLFRQLRTGLDGRKFWCLKFRSMDVDTSDGNQSNKESLKTFPFGEFMRKTSINELPQLWNVLTGNMSIVGPRPHKHTYTEEYNKLIDKYMTRHFVKPGITGWAQVTGFRGETHDLKQMEERVERDIWYIQNWSLWLDLRIIWMTAKKFFAKDKKAY